MNKPRLYQNLLIRIIAICLLCSFINILDLFAQQSNSILEIGTSVGVNKGLFESETYPSLQNGLELSLFLNPYFFLKSRFTLSSLKGYHHPTQTDFYNSITGLTTALGYSTFPFRYNNTKLPINIRAAFGISILNSNVHTTNKEGSYSFNWPFFAYYTSIHAGYQINKSLTALIGAELFLTETKWLDGIAYDGSLDKLITPNILITYRLNGQHNQTVVSQSVNDYTNELQAIQQQLLDLNKKLNQSNSDLNIKLIQKIDSLSAGLHVISSRATSLNNLAFEITLSSSSLDHDTIWVNFKDTLAKPKYLLVKMPTNKYNVIYGGYIRLEFAVQMQYKLLEQGINSELIKKSKSSRLVLISLLSTDKKREAQSALSKFRKELNSNIWLYIKPDP